MTAPVDVNATLSPSHAAGAFAIQVEGLTVRYGATAAVRDLSMHVPRGTVYGLVGPNGAGKSTTLRVLATVQQADAGLVLVDGVNIRTDPEKARGRIGYLPDSSGVYEGLTTGEYLTFYGAIYGVPAHRRRQTTEELLELMGLTDRRDSPVKMLSRGMRQKLHLARCLVHNPRVLLLDEPSSGMDPPSRRDLRDILHELARMGTTILVSSHVLQELADTCTHLGIMHAGELLAEGAMDEMMSAVSDDISVRVDLLQADDAAAARRVLEAHDACTTIESAGSATLVLRFGGTRQDLAAILGQLSAAGVRVVEFAVEQATLEDVLLRALDLGGPE